MSEYPTMLGTAPIDGAPHSNSHPYSRLTPDVVLDALASLGLHGDGRIAALPSYENRVYLIHLDQQQDGGRDAVVAKFYRPERWSEAQILEEHALALELMAAEVPMVGPLVLQGSTLHTHAGFAFSISPRRGGRYPELDDFEVLEWTGRFIARLHAVGAMQPFVSRPALNISTFGHGPRDWLLRHNAINPEMRSAWEQACDEALTLVETHAALREAASHQASGDEGPGNIQLLRLHGDCHPGNILWTPADRPDGGPHFVDLDDARTGPAVQDLWMLTSGDRANRAMQLSTLVEGYEQIRPFDRRELELIEPLRTLRLIHYSFWLAQRQADPAFTNAFSWFGTVEYWREQVAILQSQCIAMREPPLMV